MKEIRKIEFSIEDRKKILSLYESKKLSISKIAKIFDVSNSTIHRILKKENYSPRTNRKQALQYTFDEKYFDDIDSEKKLIG